MTVARKPKEEIVVTGKLGVLNYLLGQNGFRAWALLLLLTMHPIGRQLLGTFGFEFPDQRKLSVAADKVSVTEGQINSITDSVKDIKTDVASLKANNTILNSKVDELKTTFTGFQVDFNTYRNQKKDP